MYIDFAYFRAMEVDLLFRDHTKANEKFEWVPEHDLAYFLKDKIQSNVKLMQKDQYLREGGYHTNNYFK